MFFSRVDVKDQVLKIIRAFLIVVANEINAMVQITNIVMCTGKSLSEALLFGDHVVYKNCSESRIQFLYTTCSELGIFIY